MRRFFLLFLVILPFLLASCSGLEPTSQVSGTDSPASLTPQTATSPSSVEPVATSPVTPAPTQRAGEVATPSTPAGGAVILQVWVPPQFDPASGTPAGDLLAERLLAFSRRRPGVRVDVRVKAVEGPGGLLDTLTTASAAAPLALPDLVALPRGLMETAALKGLLHPYDSLSQAMEHQDWYDYARDLGRIQNSVFGLPFAGDALLLVYRPAIIPTPPADWASALQASGPMIFPAADTQALFTLAMYQAAGGEVRDDQGRPFLDVQPLTDVLGFYDEASQAGLMPFWLTQYASDDQAWEAMIENRANLAVTWASRYLGNMLADTSAAPLPTKSGSPYTLATGWVWAMAAPSENQQLAAQLAEFLTDGDFLARWSQAAGYLPSRPSSLQGWENSSQQKIAADVLNSAHLYPPAEILSSLGPALQGAAVQVLKDQAEPLIAAQQAVNALSVP